MSTESSIKRAEELWKASDPSVQCCAPILARQKNGLPEFFASGTLVLIGQHHFVITCAHVLDKAKASALLIPSSAGLVELGGPMAKIRAPSTGRKTDKVDSGFILIDPAAAEKIKSRFSFLPIKYVDNSDSAIPGRAYRFCGYPGKFQKVDHSKRIVRPQRYTFSAEPLGPEFYRERKLNEAFHIVVRFPEDKVWTDKRMRVHSPDPHEMSGGPILSVTKLALPDSRRFVLVRLAGINMEFRPDDRLLVGIRITPALEQIRFVMPELSNFIPESRTPEMIPNFFSA